MEECSSDSEEITFLLERRGRGVLTRLRNGWVAIENGLQNLQQLQNTVRNRKSRAGSYSGDGRKLLPLYPMEWSLALKKEILWQKNF